MDGPQSRRRLLAVAAATMPVAMLRWPVLAGAQPATEDLGQWSTRAAMPTARSELGVTKLGGHVYGLGGYALGDVDQPALHPVPGTEVVTTCGFGA
jgi:hypothetical protein